ncbi:MAG: zf-TFIIB domain-containing protein [Acidobacteriota bacterium]|jgi:Zn-finger nucleic acid-binding protein
MDRVCPRDFTLLSAREWQGTSYLHCDTCHGVLLERSEVERIVHSGAAHPPTGASIGEATFEDGSAPCSCSDATMVTVNRQGVAVDVCPRCKAVWFDAGELQRMVARARRQSAESDGSAPPGLLLKPSGGTVSSWGGWLALDLLGELLGAILTDWP